MADPNSLNGTLGHTPVPDSGISSDTRGLEEHIVEGQALFEATSSECEVTSAQIQPGAATLNSGHAEAMPEPIAVARSEVARSGTPCPWALFLPHADANSGTEVSPSRLEKTDEEMEHKETLMWLERFCTVGQGSRNWTTTQDFRVIDSDSISIDSISEPTYAYMLRTTPVVRDCDWHEFKNRYPDEEECCAIETLLSYRDLNAEMEFEQFERKTSEKQRSKARVTDLSADVVNQRLERVRINSTFILARLAKVTGERSWTRRPHTFLSPFTIFIHYHKDMEDEFRLLEQKFVSVWP